MDRSDSISETPQNFLFPLVAPMYKSDFDSILWFFSAASIFIYDSRPTMIMVILLYSYKTTEFQQNGGAHNSILLKEQV